MLLSVFFILLSTHLSLQSELVDPVFRGGGPFSPVGVVGCCGSFRCKQDRAFCDCSSSCLQIQGSDGCSSMCRRGYSSDSRSSMYRRGWNWVSGSQTSSGEHSCRRGPPCCGGFSRQPGLIISLEGVGKVFRPQAAMCVCWRQMCRHSAFQFFPLDSLGHSSLRECTSSIDFVFEKATGEKNIKTLCILQVYINLLIFFF